MFSDGPEVASDVNSGGNVKMIGGNILVNSEAASARVSDKIKTCCYGRKGGTGGGQRRQHYDILYCFLIVSCNWHPNQLALEEKSPCGRSLKPLEFKCRLM